MIQDSSGASGITTYTYDPTGNLVKKIPASGETDSTGYSYDALNRQTQVRFGGQNYTFDYDGSTNNRKGRLWKETGPLATRKFSYDYTGRVTAESVVASGATYPVLYVWNANGNLTKLTYPSTREVNYTYDLADRVNKVTAKMGTTTTTILDSTFYLPFGPDSSMKLGNGIKVRRKFDKRYYADSIKSTTAGIFGRSYRYDHNGNIAGLVDLIDNTKSYDTLKYDGVDRLLVAKGNNRSDSLRFTYQKNGNRLTKKKNISTTDYSYLNNRLRNTTGAEVVNYGYNANGSVIGDTLSGQTKVYIYDKLNRIVKITGIAPTDSFAYDAENKRVYKNEQGVVRNNIYDIYGNLIAEANLGPWAIDYIWANGEPRARVDNPETEGFAPLAPQIEAYWWYHTDHLGTPYVLTDKDKVVVWKISLDPFGETVSETAPLTLDNLRFPGQYADRGSGLNYNWRRYYQPKTGRYYQVDPVLADRTARRNYVDEASPSPLARVVPYLYAYNNPIIVYDPTGRSPVPLDCNSSYAARLGRAINDAVNKATGSNCLADSCLKNNFEAKVKNLIFRCIPSIIKINDDNTEDITCGQTVSFFADNILVKQEVQITPEGFDDYTACGCLKGTVMHEVIHSLGRDDAQAFSLAKKCFKCHIEQHRRITRNRGRGGFR